MALSLICLTAFLAAAVSIWLCLRLRTKLQDFALNIAVQRELVNQTEAVNARLAALDARLDVIDQSRKEHIEWLSQAEGLNLNRRGQVLRLHRRGDSVSDIASALRIGAAEVQLMIKVYELSRDGFSVEQQL